MAAARRLTDTGARRHTGRFLAEGAPAVDGALARAGTVLELFVTADALHRYAELVERAAGDNIPVSQITAKAARALSQTTTPAGLVAVCRRVDVALDVALAPGSALVAVLTETNDPGNAGAIVRTADAAGADAVILTRPGVDIYNGKAVRASAGSVFNVAVAVEADLDAVLERAAALGVQVLAATGSGARTLDDLGRAGRLARPTLWLFGNEARGLGEPVLARADERVRVPIYGRAESLNLAAAAALCLYASAGAQHADQRVAPGTSPGTAMSPDRPVAADSVHLTSTKGTSDR